MIKDHDLRHMLILKYILFLPNSVTNISEHDGVILVHGTTTLKSVVNII